MFVCYPLCAPGPSSISSKVVHMLRKDETGPVIPPPSPAWGGLFEGDGGYQQPDAQAHNQRTPQHNQVLGPNLSRIDDARLYSWKGTQLTPKQGPPPPTTHRPPSPAVSVVHCCIAVAPHTVCDWGCSLSRTSYFPKIAVACNSISRSCQLKINFLGSCVAQEACKLGCFHLSK